MIRDGKQRFVVLRGWDYVQSIESSKEKLAIAREEGNRKRSISVRCSGQVLSARRRINRVLSTVKKHCALPGMGSFHVSGKLPTFSSTKPTSTLSSYLGQNVGLGEG